MFFSLLQYYYRIRPIVLGKLFKLMFSNKRLKIGKRFQCDTFPKTLIDKDAFVEICDDVIFRRNIEIRVHNGSILTIKNRCRIDRGVRLLANNKSQIILEESVRVGLYSVFNGGDSIFVGSNTLISGFVYLQTSMHNYKGDGDIQQQGYIHSPIYIGLDNWLGTHTVIFPGVKLGKKCVVGSNSVVNKSFDENSILVGSPAVLIKKRG